MTPEIIIAFIILALVLFSIALLYKSEVDGKISIFGLSINLKASEKHKQKQISHRPEISSEVDVRANITGGKIKQVAGRDINGELEAEVEDSRSSDSKVVIQGELKDTQLEQVAGRDIKVPLTQPKSHRSNTGRAKRRGK